MLAYAMDHEIYATDPISKFNILFEIKAHVLDEYLLGWGLNLSDIE